MKRKSIAMGMISACLLWLGMGVAEKAVADTTVLRLYHPEKRVHVYTKSRQEYTTLAERGWQQEGRAWVTSDTNGEPVYRLYNPKQRVYFFTKNTSEYALLESRGWKKEGIAFRSYGTVPIYRLYHAGDKRYLYTRNKEEYNGLESRGWKKEGVAFYGIDQEVPVTTRKPNTTLKVEKPRLEITQKIEILTTDEIVYLEDSQLEVGKTREEASVNGERVVEVRRMIENSKIIKEEEVVLKETPAQPKKVYKGVKVIAPVAVQKPKTAPTSQKPKTTLRTEKPRLEITKKTEVLTTDEVVYLDDANLEVGKTREEASVNGERVIEVRRTIENSKIIKEEEVVLKETPAQPKKVYKGMKAVTPPPAPKQTSVQTVDATYRLTFNEINQAGQYSLAQDSQVMLTETQILDTQTQQVLSVNTGITKDNVMQYTLSSLYEFVEIADPKTSLFYHENERHIHIVVRRKPFDINAFVAEMQSKSAEERYQLAKAAVANPAKYQVELSQGELNAIKVALNETTYNEELLATINAERTAKGIPALELNDELAAGVKTRADEQGAEGYFRSVDIDRDGIGDKPHTRPSGTYFNTAFNLRYLTLRSENAGQYLPDDIRELISEKWQAEKQFERFKTSDSHYDNMMDPSLTVAYFAMAFSDDHKILMSRKEQTDPTQENGNAVIFIQAFGTKRSIPRW